ncbi:MAG: hypothetical protein ABI949_09605 [Ilumatobacteraceae bacterium]
MAKYDPLFEFLCRAQPGSVEIGFDTIEQLIGALPASATNQRSWWANQAGGGPNVQARAWLNAGREVEAVDLQRRVVRFGAATWLRGS